MVELAWFLAGAGTVALVEFIILFASSVGDEQIDEDFLDNSSNNKKWHNKDRLVEKRGTPVATVSQDQASYQDS